MYIETKATSSDYSIRQMARTLVAGGDHQLSWNFNRASHFLIVAHPAMQEFGLDEVIAPWLTENGDELMENRKMEADDVVWCLVPEKEFLVKKNKYTLPKAKMKTGIPYRIVVYPCRIEDDSWEIYQVSGDANVAVIPVTIPVDIKYKSPLFGRGTQCTFRIRYSDVSSLGGVLNYKPSCSRNLFPISVDSMKLAKEGWLYVQLPKGEALNILVSPEYKAYYNVKIMDN